jgi:histidine phosphotransferase ChpT
MTMTERVHPTDLELAALISSKVCHDLVNPVGATNNGFEVLDSESDPNAKAYALDVIRSASRQASARLEFARFAFGAAGGAGTLIELGKVQEIARGVIEQSNKHKLVWHPGPPFVAKDKVKLLLNLIANAVTALPHGGQIHVTFEGEEAGVAFMIRCVGNRARPPQHLPDFIMGQMTRPLDAINIQAYYTWRMAGAANMSIAILMDGADILVTAEPAV